MSQRSYGQACAVANFLDRLGDRWTLLIVRDLMIGPRRFKDLLAGLDGIGTNLLSQRLGQLREMAIVEKVALPDIGHHAYQLTEKGRELEDVILQMQRWGMQNLQGDYVDKSHRPELLVVALRAAFQPQRAQSVQIEFELRIDDVTLHGKIDKGRLETGLGPAPNPGLVLITDSGTFNELAFSRTEIETARESGRLQVLGSDSALKTFMDSFDPG